MKTSFLIEDIIGVSFADFADLLLDAVCVVDAEGRFVFVSAAFERIFGYTREEVIGRLMIDLVAREDRERTVQAASDIMSGYHKFDFENRYIHKDGQVIHIRWSARWSEDHQLRMAVAHDITDLKNSEFAQGALLAISEAAHDAENLRSLFKLIHKIIESLLPAANFSVAMLDDQTGELSFPYEADAYDEAAAIRTPAMAAFSTEIVTQGKPLLLATEELQNLPDRLRAIGSSSAVCWMGVPLNSHKGSIGALILKSYSCNCHYTEKDKELLQIVSTQVLTAIERKQLQARLQFLAQYDELTGLPNRGLLHDRLEQALARARRQRDGIAVFFLDLDKFKQVNDTFGHAAGDILLQEIADRLKRCVRSSDTVGRMSGDEFVIVLERVNQAGALLVAEKIGIAIGMPIDIGDHILHIHASIGIANYPDNGDNVGQLLKHADQAMYLAKENGQTGIRIQAKTLPGR